MPGRMSIRVSGHNLSRILRDVATGRIPTDRLTLRSPNGRRASIKRVVRHNNSIIVEA